MFNLLQMIGKLIIYQKDMGLDAEHGIIIVKFNVLITWEIIKQIDLLGVIINGAM